MDVQCARYFYSQNIPFVAAEGNEFKNFCSALRPGYNPPNRKQLGGNLLDTVYDEVLEKTKDDLKNKDCVILTQDGWSSVQNDPIIAHSFFDGEKNLLLNVKEA